MKYFNIVEKFHGGLVKLNIPNVINLGGILIDDRIENEDVEGYENRYGFFLSPDYSDIGINGINVNGFLYYIGFTDQEEIDKFCENILGYELGKFCFPETKTIEDLLKLLEALEFYYDKNHRPTR